MNFEGEKKLFKITARTFEKEINSFIIPPSAIKSEFKILTENSKTPLSRALALASFLGTDYPAAIGARTAPPSKDHMAYGSVLAHNQHNIGNEATAVNFLR